MPVIAPLPLPEIDPASRARIDAGVATGMYTMTLPLQVVARSPAAFQAMDEGYKAIFDGGLLGKRLVELLRMGSARINACEPCSLSVKDGSISAEDTACLLDPQRGSYTPRERMALDFLQQMASAPDSIDAGVYRRLGEVFSAGEIVELAWISSQMIAGHRFMHSLDMLGSAEPVLR